MYNLITSFFQGYYPVSNYTDKTPLEPDYLAVSESQLNSSEEEYLINHTNETNTNTNHIISIQEDPVLNSEDSEDDFICSSFTHLQFMRQSYFYHFKQTMKYSFLSFKASFYFFIHAIYPDIFQHTASDTVVYINDEIIQTYQDCLDRIDNELLNC